MQPIQGVSSPLAGEPPGSAPAGTQPLTSQQRTVLERLVTRIVAQGLQQNAEVWAALRHELGLARDGELQSRHFPLAEQLLNQRLDSTLSSQSERQTLSQLTLLLGLGNNRQAVCDFIRQSYGQTALSQLTPDQRAEVLRLLQAGELTIPQPQQRPPTDRPLLPAEHNALNLAVTRLSAETGESAKGIWQLLNALVGVKEGELMSVHHYAPLSTWLAARLALAPLPEVTMRQFQSVLKQPLDDAEWHTLSHDKHDNPTITASTLLTQAQVQELLNQLVLLRTGQPVSSLQPQQIQPIWRPLVVPIERGYRAISARPGLSLFVLVLVLIVVGWIMDA